MHILAEAQRSPDASPRPAVSLLVRLAPGRWRRARARTEPARAPVQLFMGYLLSSGNHWFLGVSKEGAEAAATACYLAAGIYLVYLVFCGMKVMQWNAKGGDSEALLHSEAV